MPEMTQEKYQQKLDNIFGEDEYIIKEFKGRTEPSRIRRKACGHVFSRRLKDFSPSCAGKNMCTECKDTLGRSKPNYRNNEKILKLIKQNSPELEVILDKDTPEKIKNRTKLKTRCIHCGKEIHRRAGHLLEGTRCPCTPSNAQKEYYKSLKGRSPNQGNILSKDEFVKRLTNKLGNNYELRSEYNGENNDITVFHKTCGNEVTLLARNLLKYTFDKCPKCSNSVKKSDEEYKQEIKEKRNDEFNVLTKYYNNKTDLFIRHKLCGTQFLMRADCLLRGDQCPFCRKHGNQKSNEEYKKEVFELYHGEYEVVGKYVRKGERIEILHHCKDGEDHIFSTYASDFLHKERKCPKCFHSNHKSKGEKELIKFIKSLFSKEDEVTVITNDRDLIKPYELDVYIPEKNIAFEYDGLYYHSEKMITYRDPQSYHLMKTMKCQDSGVRLVHIFEDEWMNKRDIVEGKIRYLLKKSNKQSLNLSDKKHNYYIKEIDVQTKNEFLDKNHIQGADKAKIKLGLYFKFKNGTEELVSVMTFRKPNNKNIKNYDYELSRFASTTDYIVMNSFEKLLKYFKDNYEWEKIFTYADRRWSNGNIYRNNGWKEKIIKSQIPSYWYTDFKKRYHRAGFMKSKLKTKYPDLYDENLTEEEIMKSTGLFRIYDCGTLKFEYSK